MIQRHVFVADVHLRRDQLAKRDALTAYLALLRAPDVHLYLLGDLFDVWVGEVQLEIEPELAPVIDALRTFVGAGGKLTFFHGNRDYFMGNYLTRKLGAQTVRNSKIIDLDGRRTYLNHGDLLCTSDQLYHVARWILHSPFFLAVYHYLPVRLKYGGTDSYKSLSERQDRERREKRHGINRAKVRRLVRRSVELIICGHVHRHLDRIYRVGARQARLIALPPWHEHGSALEYADGLFTLKTINFA